MLNDLETVRGTLITTPSGVQVPLHALAEICKDHGPNTISRENVQRKIVVMSNVAGRDLHSVVDDIRARIEQAVRLPHRVRRAVRERGASPAHRPVGLRAGPSRDALALAWTGRAWSAPRTPAYVS